MCATLRKVKSSTVNLCADRNLISYSLTETQIGLASVCPVVSSLWPLCKWQSSTHTSINHPTFIRAFRSNRHQNQNQRVVCWPVGRETKHHTPLALEWADFSFFIFATLKLYFTSQAKHRIQLNLKGVWKKYIYTGTRNLHKQTLNRRGIWYNMWVKLQGDEHAAKMRLKLHCCE